MSLEDVRKKIDSIDFEIMKLLAERMELAMRTKRLKEGIEDTEREMALIGNLTKHAHGLIRPEFSERLFKEILTESKLVQTQKLKYIGFQGEHGAFGELASRGYDDSLLTISCQSFVDVFEGVKEGVLDYGIVPVENSLEGAVTEVSDMLADTDLKVIGAVKLPVHHYLLALPDTDYREIKVVYSHPQALAQCRKFIARNRLEAMPFYDTAGAARFLSTSKPKAAAAIASSLCTKLYNLESIKENIEDSANNYTRFFVLSKEKGHAGEKCSVIFSVKHEAGALFKVLKLFADVDINLTRIESRPLRTDPGNYTFLLDFLGSESDGKVQDVLQNIKRLTQTFRLLGFYKELEL
jgi:prephenate dehydratase/chorismate mutase/prephenate dehydratase